MKIGGFLPTTLLDYPEKLACTVFTRGCNFRCPFCQNGSLVLGTDEGEQYEADEILRRLEKRKNILEGVCITGGEPTLQKDLPDFIKAIKDLGLLVKLDTNGSCPEMIISLYQNKLLDYVAMDIKSSKENYPEICGIPGLSVAGVEESADFLLHSGISYEFRTTLVKGMHTYEDMTAIAEWLRGARKYFLQSFEDGEQILSKFVPGDSDKKLDTFSEEELRHFLEIARSAIPAASLRGV